MKPLKVFWNGNRLKDVYPFATRFQVFKFRVKRFIRKTIIFILVTVTAILSAGYLIEIKTPAEVIRTTEYITADNDLKAKIIELKSEVLDKLKKCESGELTEDSGLIVFDSNKVASIGLYQFQVKTVIGYYKALYGKDITGKEAIEIALSEEKSRKLAEDIIFGEKDGINNWYNCKNKNNLSENITWINKISN